MARNVLLPDCSVLVTQLRAYRRAGCSDALQDQRGEERCYDFDVLVTGP